MKVTVNGENYDTAKTHELFNQCREAIKSHGITDDHGLVGKVLSYIEMFIHILGSLPAICKLTNEE